MPNYEEGQMICGLADIDQILKCFLDQGAAHVVLRLGEKGSVVAWSKNGCLKQFAGSGFDRLWRRQ